MKPFLTNKGAFSDSNIVIETENENIVNNEETLVKLFNNYSTTKKENGGIIVSTIKNICDRWKLRRW